MASALASSLLVAAGAVVLDLRDIQREQVFQQLAVPDRAFGGGGHTGRHQLGDAGVGVPVGCKADNALLGLEGVPEAGQAATLQVALE